MYNTTTTTNNNNNNHNMNCNPLRTFHVTNEVRTPVPD